MDWSSLLGGGGDTGGGGGGGMGGFDLGGMMKAGANANDAVVSETTAPYAMRRQRILALAPLEDEIGTGIQPVASSRGGAAMVGAMARERNVATRMSAAERGSLLDKNIRNVNAKGKVAHDSAAIAKKIAEMIAGGYMAGSAGMGGGDTPAAAGSMTSADAAGGTAMGGGGVAGGFNANMTSAAEPTLSTSPPGGSFDWGAAARKVGQDYVNGLGRRHSTDDGYLGDLYSYYGGGM